MSSPSTPTAPPPTLPVTGLRIVLFGMPDAGKSSLLGALAQAAQTQEHLLNGHLTDPSQGLHELQHRLYDEQPRRTPEEVKPYPVTLEPHTPAAPLEAVLVDCDGQAARQILDRQRVLGTDANESALARPIIDADTLVMVVDASGSAAMVERDFEQFGRFLRLFEQGRGRRSDVGGLPVYLVLTKGDLLAQPGDTAITWMERMEERKRQVGDRFREFLTRQTAKHPQAFGRIALHLWATAVKRPALGDAAARPREPYGVAELFRQCLDSARGFHNRRTASARRLRHTVAAVTAVVAGLALLVAFLVLTRQTTEVSALERDVRNYRNGEGRSAEDRLQDPVAKTLTRLEGYRLNPQ